MMGAGQIFCFKITAPFVFVEDAFSVSGSKWDCVRLNPRQEDHYEVS
jgi:hypothetical protein